MATYTYPSNVVLRQIVQDKLPTLLANDPIFTYFPTRDVDASLVMWDQLDNYTGLQQLRGMNGEPPVVKQIGAKSYQVRPGVYGEFARIDELQLTERRQYGSWDTPISVDDLVMQKQDYLLGRQIDRMRWILWTLVTTGTFSVQLPDAAVGHSDTYTMQTYSAAVPWATIATATPLADLSAIQLLARGHSLNFGAGAVAFMNRVTFNNMRSNTNAADLYGRRTAGLGTANSQDLINGLLQADDLPGIRIWDDGYLNDSGTFVPFIPNAKVVVFGQRPGGAPIGEMQLTRNASNPGLAPGAYTKVVDDPNEVPRNIEVHAGWNGSPALWFPSAIVVASV
jgi:hypothetical protein